MLHMEEVRLTFDARYNVSISNFHICQFCDLLLKADLILVVNQGFKRKETLGQAGLLSGKSLCRASLTSESDP